MEKGQTAGNPNTPVGAKAYYKPAIGKLVLRKPGVLRRSEKVIARNIKVAEKKPATACKGIAATKGFKGFKTCLREEMKKIK
jgi:hypothetical protein